MPQNTSVRDPRPAAEVIATEGVAKAIGLKHVASVLYTYRCTIACRHCLFNCCPEQPDVHVSHEDGLEFLRQLHATDRVIHIAGGEALMYYASVLALCRDAQERGIAPHFIESNAAWCVSDELTRERFTALRSAGVQGMYLSADPYHQTFFPPINRFRGYRISVEVFGKQNVAAADVSLEQLEQCRRVGQDDTLLTEHVRKGPPKLVGRAGNELAVLLPERRPEDLAKDSLWRWPSPDGGCAPEFDPDKMWEIHVDPYGNVQTCCGIVAGNVHRTPLPELVARGFHQDNDLVRRVYERGPFGLLELAVARGYQPRKGYAQRCHLCWEVRKFLRPRYPDTFGPAEVYEPPA
jgi:hypothetical protein